MNRRAFLARLGFGTVAAAAAATGVIDIERLLWTPGEKTIFIPPAVSPLGVGFTVGDVFTIQGVYAVNPLTYAELPRLQQFVITSSVSAGSTLTVEKVHPRIITDGIYKNASSSPVRSGRIDGTLVKPLMWTTE